MQCRRCKRRGEEPKKAPKGWRFGVGVSPPLKNFIDSSLKKAILKYFKMIISLLYINTIVCVILIIIIIKILFHKI